MLLAVWHEPFPVLIQGTPVLARVEKCHRGPAEGWGLRALGFVFTAQKLTYSLNTPPFLHLAPVNG